MMMVCRKFFARCAALFAAFALTLAPLAAEANPELSGIQQRIRQRNPGFAVPPELAPRVKFWLDIFTKYGKHQVVIHHRDYPQAVFAVLDFSKDAEELSPVALERYRKQRVDEVSKRVLHAVRGLAAGDSPESELAQNVESAMRFVRGRDKYRELLAAPDLVRSQTGIREKCADALERSGLYLPEIERIFVREFGLPIELTRLPFIESSFDYRAYSSVGAAGIWQLMPRTARQYLTVSRTVDERRDPITASYASARYLQGAYESLGSWPLAVTSYNHGVGGVSKKVREYGTADIARLIERPGDRPFGFASSNFFPEFLAALEVFERPSVYFPEVRVASPLEITKVPLQSAMPISQVSRKLGVSIAELQQVNFALADTVWSGRYPVPKGYQVRVQRKGAITAAKLLEPEIYSAPPTPAPMTSAYAGALYRVRKGDTLASIAKRYRTTVSNLQQLNDISDGALRIGQQLVVGEHGAAHVEEKKAPKPVSHRVSYTVKSGDSLHSIAQQFGVSVGQIRELNRLSSTKIKPGQQLVVEPKRNAGGSKK